VRIPVGVQEGQMIRVSGKGEEGHNGGPAGDLYLRVRFEQHPDFRVRGPDIYCDLDLAPWEAVLGTTVSIPALEGAVSVRVPPGAGRGQQLRVRGKGLPKNAGGDRGDLYAIIGVQAPGEVSPEERKLWQELAERSSFNPRKV
jgi:curved DNA-binding protein